MAGWRAGNNRFIESNRFRVVCLTLCCLCCRWDKLQDPVHIALIGKYTVLSDAYLSVLKALQHACMAAGLKLSLTWVEAQHLEPEAKEECPDKYEESWKQVSCWWSDGWVWWFDWLLMAAVFKQQGKKAEFGVGLILLD